MNDLKDYIVPDQSYLPERLKDKEDVISIKDLVIKYKTIDSFSFKRDLFHHGAPKSKYFEAVKGLTFNVKEGEILGIIGKNGSGKSTLLRAIANIYTPDSGSIDLHGRTISLMAIGVGFNKELTGRKNIELAGLLLGFSKEEIAAKSDDIIEFAQLGDFIDKPVRTYSSGMYSKLAFGITVCLETDIMLIDEVLSVGDERFKSKSFRKMKELITRDDKTVVIVSHSTGLLSELCDRIMWVNDGEIIQVGEPAEVVERYKEYMNS